MSTLVERLDDLRGDVLTDGYCEAAEAMHGAARRIERLEAELAASQAREAKLRSVVLECEPLILEFPFVRRIVREALALPHDDTALQERLKAERERCAKIVREVAYRLSPGSPHREMVETAVEAIRDLGDE